MKRYLLAALAAGTLYVLMGLVFVHYVLDETLRNELARVLAAAAGDAPPAAAAVEAAGDTDWGQFALHTLLRLLFGFLTMGLFVLAVRKRPRFRAARIAGAVFWVLAYFAWPIFLSVRTGMSTTLLFVCMGYGLVETQLAAHLGAVAWGKDAPPK